VLVYWHEHLIISVKISKSNYNWNKKLCYGLHTYVQIMYIMIICIRHKYRCDAPYWTSLSSVKIWYMHWKQPDDSRSRCPFIKSGISLSDSEVHPTKMFRYRKMPGKKHSGKYKIILCHLETSKRVFWVIAKLENQHLNTENNLSETI